MQEITEQSVLAALSHVEEPDLKKDLVTLKMIKDIEIKKRHVKFTVILTTPACPLKELIQNACQTAIKHFHGNDVEVEVLMTSKVHTPSNPDFPTVKNIIAVASGKGGVGKSTLASNLAIALSLTGAKVGLLDADIYGPSIPIMFDLVDSRPYVETVDGKDMMLPIEKFGIEIMSIGFLVTAETSTVWRGPMASNILKQMLSQTLWGDLDYLILDLPPGTGDIHITIAQSLPITGVVIVTTPQTVAVADSRKAAAMFISKDINIPILGTVENMAYFTPDELPNNKYYIFGKGGAKRLAEEFNTTCLGEVPIIEAIRECSDAGSPIALNQESVSGKAFAHIAGNVARMASMASLKTSL